MTIEELEERVAFLESELVCAQELARYWKEKTGHLYDEMKKNPVSNDNLRHRLYWYQRRYAPLCKRMHEAEKFMYTPLGEVAKIAVARGRLIHKLERKLGKRNRLSAKQHRYLKSRDRELRNALAREMMDSQTLGW